MDPSNLLISHARLCELEQNLQKQRNALIQNYNFDFGTPNSNRLLYGSYYPMLEKYTTDADQYVTELANFKVLLQNSVQQKVEVSTGSTAVPNTPPIPHTQANNNNESSERPMTVQTVSDNNGNNKNTVDNIASENGQSQREFAPMNNGHTDDDCKEKESLVSPQSTDENETKLSSLYTHTRKPPVKSGQNSEAKNEMSNINSAPITRVKKPKRKNRQILVARHKYRHNDKDFQMFWKRNFQRPMYTVTSLKINKKFGGNEKLVRKFMYEKGGFKPELTEQITFIGGQSQSKENGKKRIDFTLVRVRASLTYIYSCIAKIEESEGTNVIFKQNNRGNRRNNSGAVQQSNKLYVSNFDILSKHCHADLTHIFISFGELERDIFVGRDKKTRNPFAKVEFRNVRSAANCVEMHKNKRNELFFPPKKSVFNDDKSGTQPRQRKLYLNRRLNINYNIPMQATNFNQQRARGNNFNNNYRGRGNQNNRR